MDRDKRVDDILEKSCHIIDIFPDVVPCDRWDVFAQVEDFFLSKGEIGYLADKFTHIITKMVCYFSYEVYKGKWIGTVDVCTLAGMIREVILNKHGFLNVLLSDENTLIQVSGGDINLTVYNPVLHNELVVQAFGICSKESNAMKSDNPRSGFYEADTARTLDCNCNNPSSNQGGIAVVAVQGSMIGREDKNGPQGSGVNEDVCFSLTGADRHAVAYPTYCTSKNSHFTRAEKELSDTLVG